MKEVRHFRWAIAALVLLSLLVLMVRGMPPPADSAGRAVGVGAGTDRDGGAAADPAAGDGGAAAAVSSATAAGVQAQQAEAARAAADAPPPPARVTARPDYVSALEWEVLTGLAARAPDPARELAHLVARLRFFKQLEQFRAAPAAALADSLLAELPARVAAADVAPDSARTLLAELLAVLEPDPAARAARQEAETARLRQAVQAAPHPGPAAAPVPGDGR